MDTAIRSLLLLHSSEIRKYLISLFVMVSDSHACCHTVSYQIEEMSMIFRVFHGKSPAKHVRDHLCIMEIYLPNFYLTIYFVANGC